VSDLDTTIELNPAPSECNMSILDNKMMQYNCSLSDPRGFLGKNKSKKLELNFESTDYTIRQGFESNFQFTMTLNTTSKQGEVVSKKTIKWEKADADLFMKSSAQPRTKSWVHQNQTTQKLHLNHLYEVVFSLRTCNYVLSKL